MAQQHKVSPEEIMQYCTNNFKIIMPVQKNEISELNPNLQGMNRANIEEEAFAKTSAIFQPSQGGGNHLASSYQKKIQYNPLTNSPLLQANHQGMQHQQNYMMQVNSLHPQQQSLSAPVVNQNPYASSKMLKSFITPFEKHHLQELVEQTDIMIQLLIQNLFLATSESTQHQTYNLLAKIIERRDQVLARIGQDHKLISYNIPIELFNEENKQKELSIDFVPQMSIFQSPLLNTLPQMKNLLKQKNNLTKEQIVDQIGAEFSPIINKLYLPIFSSNFGKNSSRSKFTPLDDNLLLQGLTKYGTSQNMDQIRSIFLQEKQTQEIKHRYKNLICSKAQPNNIKQWKNQQYSPLSENEIKQFLKGLKWFGTEHKFNTISKYFFQNLRSGNLLEQEFYNKEKLNKKRKKHNYEVTNVKYSQLLQNYENQDLLMQSLKVSSKFVSKQDSNSFSDVIQELNNGDKKKQQNTENQDNSFSSEKRQSSEGNIRYDNQNQMRMNPQKKIKLDSQQLSQYDNSFQNNNQQLNRSFNILNSSFMNNNNNTNQTLNTSQFNLQNKNINESILNTNNKYNNDFNKSALDYQSYNSANDLSMKDRRQSPDQYQNNNNYYLNNNSTNKLSSNLINNSNMNNNNNGSYSQFNNNLNKQPKFKMINNVTYEYDEI